MYDCEWIMNNDIENYLEKNWDLNLVFHLFQMYGRHDRELNTCFKY